MSRIRAYALRKPERIAIITIGFMLAHGEVSAVDKLSGRLDLAYQRSTSPVLDQSYFTQHLETRLRDRLFEKNDISLAFYLDNSQNLTFDLTSRRYRFDLDLSNPYYRVNVRVTPRQKTTPLELANASEVTENRASLEVRVPHLPFLRLSYLGRRRYEEGVFAGDTRELRGDLNYTYKFVEIGLNRLNSTRTNDANSETNVSGGLLRLSKTFGPKLTVGTGYEYQLTEDIRPVGTKRTVTSQTLSGLATGRHKNLVTGTLSLTTRWLDVQDRSANETRDDNFNFLLTLFPGRPVNVTGIRTFLRTEQDSRVTQSDYATLQLVAEGEIVEGTDGRAQISRRFDINSIGQAVPPHIYYTSLRSRIYPGVDLRADLNVSERFRGVLERVRYQMSSLLELFLKPTDRFNLTPHANFVKYHDSVSFLHNDRATYGVIVNYFPVNNVNAGLNLERVRVATGRQRKDSSVSFVLGLTLRNRSSFNLSYGINSQNLLEQALPDQLAPADRTRTLNLQAEIFITKRGALTMNYSDIAQDLGGDTRNSSVAFRQDF